jgi:hypothetical protein
VLYGIVGGVDTARDQHLAVRQQRGGHGTARDIEPSTCGRLLARPVPSDLTSTKGYDGILQDLNAGIVERGGRSV